MARMTRTVTDYTDDMTGLAVSEADVDASFTFSIDGANFTIDTHSDTANEIREVLTRAAANAEIEYYRPQTPAPKSKKRTNPERTRLLKKIRFWANENGYACPDRGRVPESIVASYRNANAGVDMTPYNEL